MNEHKVSLSKRVLMRVTQTICPDGPLKKNELESSKRKALAQLISSKELIDSFDFLPLKRFIVDNLLVFMLTLAGYRLWQLMMHQPILIMAPGIMLAVLFLKGNAIIPALIASCMAFLWVPIRFDVHNTILILYQLSPIILLRYLVNRAHHATVLSFSFSEQLVYYLGVIIAAFFVVYPFYSANLSLFICTWLGVINGILVSTIVITALDLYFIDWCMISKREWIQIMCSLIFFVAFSCGLFLALSPLSFTPLMILSSVIFLISIYRYFMEYGLILSIFVLAFSELMISFFIMFSWQQMLGLQLSLLIAVMATYFLLRRHVSESTC